jgi:hypothetical protein
MYPFVVPEFLLLPLFDALSICEIKMKRIQRNHEFPSAYTYFSGSCNSSLFVNKRMTSIACAGSGK